MVSLSQDAPLATCKEHIVCLEEIRNVLEMKTAPNTELSEIHEINGKKSPHKYMNCEFCFQGTHVCYL